MCSLLSTQFQIALVQMPTICNNIGKGILAFPSNRLYTRLKGENHMKNEYGKHGSRNSKRRTGNLKTQDVKPKTENTEPETSLLIGPNFVATKLGRICPHLELCSREETGGFSEADLRPKSLFFAAERMK